MKGYLAGYLQKTAGPISEYMAGVPTSVAMSAAPSLMHGNEAGLMAAANTVGGLAAPAAGLLQGASEEDLEKMNENPAVGVVPFAVGNRAGKRIAATHRRSREANGEDSKSLRNILSEIVGPTTSSVLPAFAGSIGGMAIADAAGATPHQQGAAALGGGLAAGLGPTIIGMLLAAAKKRRTKEEQAEYDSEGQALKNMLLPGVASYNYSKRLGSTGKSNPEGISEY